MIPIVITLLVLPGLTKVVFTAPAAYTFGIKERNDLSGNPFHHLDLSLFKSVKVRNIGNLQFRAEALNALNHLTYGNPDGDITFTTFEVVGSERSTERQFQLALS